MDRFSDWCVNRHKETNHFYDGDIPYRLHLDLVYRVAQQYRNVAPVIFGGGIYLIKSCCYGHDLIEDTRTTYNDIMVALQRDGQLNSDAIIVADVIKACTNYNRGKNRLERMPDFVYADIRTTPGATFIKLCDRIANIEFSVLTGSRMLDVYRKENEHFIEKLYNSDYEIMFSKIRKLLEK